MPFFSEVRCQRIYENIIFQIKELIHEKKLRPGDRLPSERTMAGYLGCSRTSVREAFRVLEADGLVVSRQGGGRFIQNSDQDMVMSYRLNPSDVIEKNAMLHFIEAREALEPKIVELACKRATEQELAAIKRDLENPTTDFETAGKKIETPLNFHLSLAQASHNFILVSMMQANANLICRIGKWTLFSRKRRAEDLQEHEAILNALLDRDTALAVKAVGDHLSALRRFILIHEGGVEKNETK